MRLFLALPLSEDLRRRIGERRRVLEEVAPPARWVRPEVLHLTLAFLGERSPTIIDPLMACLRAELENQSSFSASLVELGAFPPRGRARVLWVGLDREDELSTLHQRVQTAIESVLGGEAATDCPFRPHLTLARCRRPWPRRFLQELQDVWSPSGLEMRVDRVTLFSSRLHPSGAVHDEVGVVHLEDPMRDRRQEPVVRVSPREGET